MTPPTPIQEREIARRSERIEPLLSLIGQDHYLNDLFQFNGLQSSIRNGQRHADHTQYLLDALPEAQARELAQLRHDLRGAANADDRARLQDRIRNLVGPEFIRAYNRAHGCADRLREQSAASLLPRRQSTIQCHQPAQLQPQRDVVTAQDRDAIAAIRQTLDQSRDLAFLRNLPPGDTTCLVDRRLNVSDEFVRQIDQALERVPLGVRNALARAGYRVVLGDRVTDVLPHLRGERPRGWPPGSTWDNADGLCDDERRRIIATERHMQDGRLVNSGRGAGVVRHELSHALDAVLGGGNGNFFCDSADFTAAYERDLRNLSAEQRASRSYQIQPGHPGRSETLADVTAAIFGSATNASETEAVLRAFPEVARLMRERIRRLE